MARDRMARAAREELSKIIGDDHIPAYLGGPVPSDADATLAQLKLYRPYLTVDQEAALAGAPEPE